jgi:hypothetical protein
MKKLLVLVGCIALLGFGCASSSTTTPESSLPTPSAIRSQMGGISDAQEVLRAHALLIIEAQTAGVDHNVTEDWSDRAQVAAESIQDGDFETAVKEISELNDEIRTYLDAR